MSKASDAFRTISEVADWLDTPAHVLRFWESKFSQVKPVKRAGGRRYYRPSDMLLLGGIKRLLHQDGMAIKGVQKLLREKGVAHVSKLSLHSIDSDATVIEIETVLDDNPPVEPDQPVFRSIGPAAEPDQSSEETNQMSFPGFGFASERSKREPSAPDTKANAESEKKVEIEVQTHAEDTSLSEDSSDPVPIDITHIPDDPVYDEQVSIAGILGKLSAMKTGSLAGSPAGLKDAVEKLATLAEARASSGNT